MNSESSKFFKINKVAKTFIMFVLACCILMNFVENFRAIRTTDLIKIIDISFNLNIVFLIFFILCVYFENNYTTIILIIINILFWYLTITERKDLSWYDNPINHYDSVLYSFANFFDVFFRKIMYKTVSSLGFLNNLLIWIIIIPFRIYKFYLYKKNVTT